MTGHLIVTDEDAIRVITLRQPGKKNAITQDMYRGMSEAIDGAQSNPAIRCIIITGGLGAFTAGNDLEDFLKDGASNTGAPRASEATRFLYSLAHNAKPIIAAVDGVAAGAGAIIAMAADLRLGTPQAQVSFLFNRVGLAGCDMGACGILPRIIGQGRATELLLTGRAMTAQEGEQWGFFNRVVDARSLEGEALALARRIASGPTFANGITKTQLNQEWSMSLDQIIEAEAQAQAICMQTKDFERAYRAFVAKQKPAFEGN